MNKHPFLFSCIVSILFSCADKASTEWANRDSTEVVAPLADTSAAYRPMREETNTPAFPSPTDSLPEKAFIPEGYELMDKVCGNLNRDTLTDCVLRIGKENEEGSQLLLILLRNANNTYCLSLHTSSFISMRYGTELEIRDSCLYIRTDHPWHGTNIAGYVLALKDKDWYCIRASSAHDDAAGNSWNSSMDYETGAFSTSHSYTTIEGKTFDRKEEGVVNVEPVPASEEKITALLTIQWKGKEYYIWDRNDLWSEEEILKLLPMEYQQLIGNWHTEKDHKIYLSFYSDGTFNFNDFNTVKNKYEYLSGSYTIKGNTLTLQYSDRSQQRFILSTRDGAQHITKTGGYDFVKE